jgi:glycosyltransferase involved in cell wall biosynthesis
MAREIPRTVLSFLPDYQRGIDPDDIEILVMENGSSHPVPEHIIASWPDNVRYINVQNPHPSPARALNQGVAMARGDWVCPVIDGARMVTPGLITSAHHIMRAYDNPLITTLGFHLGDQVQQLNVQEGYNQDIEDQLLASIDWPNNPYKLFDISCLGGSAQKAWFNTIAESNVLIMKKEFYETLGGYDEAFDIPGGGLVNLDFFNRAVGDLSAEYIMFLNEGSFHQYHGGVTTSRPVSKTSLEDKTRTTWQLYAQQYERIRGLPYAGPKRAPILHGEMIPEVQRIFLAAAQHVLDEEKAKRENP